MRVTVPVFAAFPHEISIRNQFVAQIHVRFAAVSRLSHAVSRCLAVVNLCNKLVAYRSPMGSSPDRFSLLVLPSVPCAFREAVRINYGFAN